MPAVRVLIADDDSLVRHALRVFVTAAGNLTVVGEATDGARARERSLALQPDVVLMDLQMPTMNGIEATRTITAELPETRVIAVTTFSSERQVIAALQAGASGYLVKDTPPEEIIAAINDVYEGRSVLSPRITQELISAVRADGTAEGEDSEPLTERELSIVQLLARGMSNAEIAQDLHLSEATVKAHLGRTMNKWGVRDRVQVLIRAVKSNLVSL